MKCQEISREDIGVHNNSRARIGAPAGSAPAHHGWAWTTGKNVDVVGVIKKVSLGNPHGILHVDIDGEVWTVEVGQPWRNERAG